MKARADALRPASILAAVEMANLLGLGEFVSKPKLESDPMHDYGGNRTQRELRCGPCRKWVSRRVRYEGRGTLNGAAYPLSTEFSCRFTCCFSGC